MPQVRDLATGKFTDDVTAEKLEKPKEPTMTEETKKVLTDWTADQIGVKPEEFVEKPEKGADKPKDEKVEKADKKEPEKKVAPKAKVPPKAAPADKPLTADQIAEAAARGAATAFAATSKKPEEKKEEKGPDLTPAQQRKVSVLDRMEKLYPERYKGAATKYQENTAKLAAYAAKWEKENLGQTFDGEADEHKDFFDGNELYDFWEPEDYTEAIADLRAEKIMADKERATNERMTALERREKVAEKAPEINEEKNASAHFFFTALGGNVFPDLLGEDGMPVMDKVKALIQSDEDVRKQYVALGDEVAELYKVVNMLEPVIEKEPDRMVNGRPNPRHKQWETQRDLSQFFTEKERAMASQSPENRRDGEGRDFLPSAEYYKRLNANAAETQQYFWTYSVRELTAIRAMDFAKKIADQEDSRRQWAERRGITLPNKPQPKLQPGASKTEVEADDNDGKPDSPGSSMQTRMAATKHKGVIPQKDGIEGWVESGIAGS